MRLSDCKTVEQIKAFIKSKYGFEIVLLKESLSTPPPIRVKEVVGNKVYIAFDRNHIDKQLIPVLIKHEIGHVVFQGAKEGVPVYYRGEDGLVSVIIGDFLKEWHVEVNIEHEKWYSLDEINLRIKELLRTINNKMPPPEIKYAKMDPLVSLSELYDYPIFFLYNKQNMLVNSYKKKGYFIEARVLEKIANILRKNEKKALKFYKEFVETDYFDIYNQIVPIGKKLVKKLWKIYGFDPIKLLNLLQRDPFLMNAAEELYNS